MMKLAYLSRPGILALVSAFALAAACGDEPGGSEDGDDEGSAADGGEPASTGGRSGSTSSGGASGTGTRTGGTAGDTSPGGMTGDAGDSGTGTGGTSAGGTNNGGTDTGGTDTGGGGTNTGGAGGSGNTGGMGSSGMNSGGMGGGPPPTCGSTFSVTNDGFALAPGASGCWHGYAFTGGDAGSVVGPTNFSMCGAGCMLRVTGTLGAATASNMYAGLAFVGFNVNQEAGSTTRGTITPAGTALQVAYTKAAGPTTIRIQIQSGTTRWCAVLGGSPVSIPYATFNTQCWDGLGTAYARQPIDGLQIVAPGGAAAIPLDMTLISVRDI